jgi:Rap1a immunity proteins
MLMLAADYQGAQADETDETLKQLDLAMKQLDLALFCDKHVGHPRCKKIEEERLFCKNNPDDDHCKEESASTLLLWCESKDPSARGRCDGALSVFAHDGAGSSLFGMSAPAALPQWQCVPPGVIEDTEQLRRLFLREAERTPEVLHRPARLLLYYAVAKAFPCPLRATTPEAR